LRVVFWNIHGRLAVKITEPDIVRLITNNDIVIFQETFLRIGEETTLDLPNGFEIVAMSRPDVAGMRSAWGGVAAVIRIGLPYRIMEHLSAPDLLVLDLDDISIIGAYVLPARSPWSEWTDVDPERKLAEAVTVLSALPDKPLLVGGDINGRTGERIPAGSFLARSSADPAVNKRGRWLLRLCSDSALTILNGTTRESIHRGAFTSFQPMGASVIDYCCVSSTLVPRISDGALCIEECHEWSDHAQLHLSIAQSEDMAKQISAAAEEPSHPFVFNDPTPLDILVKSTLELAVSSADATARLYGEVSTTSTAVTVYLATATGRDRTAFAVWQGEGCKWNCSFLIDEGGSDACAALLAVLCAARDCPADRRLTIYTASQYAIRSFCYWAGDHETEGWSCANGLVIRDTVEWLAQRTAPVEFRWVDTGQANKSLTAAKAGARAALASHALPFTYSRAPTVVALPAVTPNPPKVTTTLQEVSDPKPQPMAPITADEIVDEDEGHRGRKRYGDKLRTEL
ncbi:reverse transcriptase domain-containing protein, partial [Favolaschia claudopus]